ncbi:uncharacterized protein [Antedon mediterranea]|uniref:uncharacterized protein n=1 Tax=Antedon mediterranea TaxID=105859 RepID=UPI003AF4E1D3
MADSKLSKLLECPLCLEQLQEPKVFMCGHSFCKGCLKKRIQENRRGNLTCPRCYQRHPVTEAVIDSLPSNFMANGLLAIVENGENTGSAAEPLHGFRGISDRLEKDMIDYGKKVENSLTKVRENTADQQKASCMKDIHDCTESLIESIKAREQELCKELHVDKIRVNKKQTDKPKEIVTNLDKQLQVASLDRKVNSDDVTARRSRDRATNALRCQERSMSELEPEDNANDESHSFNSRCQSSRIDSETVAYNVGLFSKRLTDCWKIQMVISIAERVYAQVNKIDSLSPDIEIDRINARMIYDNDNLTVNIEKHNSNRFKLTAQCKKFWLGKYELHVYIDDRPITNSPKTFRR